MGVGRRNYTAMERLHDDRSREEPLGGGTEVCARKQWADNNVGKESGCGTETNCSENRQKQKETTDAAH